MTTALRQRMHQDLQLTAGLSEPHSGRLTSSAVRRNWPTTSTRGQTGSASSKSVTICSISRTIATSASASLDHRLLRHQVLLPPHRATRLALTLTLTPRPPGQAHFGPTCSPSRKFVSSSPRSARPTTRAYFWTVYSLGLRLGEGLNLQVRDIDSGRMMVHVHRGKGARRPLRPLAVEHTEDPSRVLGHPSSSPSGSFRRPAVITTQAAAHGRRSDGAVERPGEPSGGWCWRAEDPEGDLDSHPEAQLRDPLTRSGRQPPADPAVPGPQLAAHDDGLSPSHQGQPGAGVCPDRLRS